MKINVFISSVIEGLEGLRALTKNFINDLSSRYPVAPMTVDDIIRDKRFDIPIPPQSACLHGVAMSRVLVALLGHRYGPKQESGLSATHEEIRCALQKGKYILVFIDKDAPPDDSQNKMIKEIGRWETGRLLHYVSFRDSNVFEALFREQMVRVLERIISEDDLLVDDMLTEYEARFQFEDCTACATAQCGAFLAGDWSILGHGRALLLPIDAKVRVAVADPATNKTTVHVYERSDTTWSLHARYSKRLSSIVEKALKWSELRKQFPWLPSAIRLICFSDVPMGSGAHEDAAFCLATASCIAQLASQTDECVAQLAGAILSRWYAQVSWATVCRASIKDEPGKHVLYFCRNSNGIDLRTFVSGDAKDDEVTQNALYGIKECRIKQMYFDLNCISVWIGKSAALEIGESVIHYRKAVNRLDYEATNNIVCRMEEHLRECRFSEVGWLMQMHQLALAEAGFVNPEYQELLSFINGLPTVYGAKSSCARGRGAVLIFTREPVDPSSSLYDALSSRGLRPISLMNTRCEGVVAGKHW